MTGYQGNRGFRVVLLFLFILWFKFHRLNGRLLVDVVGSERRQLGRYMSVGIDGRGGPGAILLLQTIVPVLEGMMVLGIRIYYRSGWILII